MQAEACAECWNTDDAELVVVAFGSMARIARSAIRKLGKREQNILYLRFFQGRTQTEVAKEIGISQAQVSRLEKKAILQVRSAAGVEKS